MLHRRRRLRLESLEPRIVMAGAPVVVGTTLRIDGTDGNDVFQFVAGAARAVQVNGAAFAVPANVTRVVFNGGGGHDSMTAWAAGAAELRPGSARLFNPGREVTVEAVETIKVHGTAALAVKFFDSAGADTFADRDNSARMLGPGYDNSALGFGTVTATSDGHAGDVAWFYNLAGAHVFSGRETSARSFNSVHQATGFNFAKVYARGLDGEADVAEMTGTTGDDRFVGRAGESRQWGARYHHVAYGFARAVGRGGGGSGDTADLYGGAGDDELNAWPIFARLTGAGFSIEANAFDAVHARAGAGGHDVAYLYDGDGFDLFQSAPRTSSLTGNGAFNSASDFDVVAARSTHGGADEAVFTDSAGADVFQWRDLRAQLTGAGFDNRALGFKQVELSATAGGADQAWLTAAGGAESYTAAGDAGTLAGPTRYVRHTGIETVHVAWPAEMHPAPQPMNIAYDLRYSSLTAGNPLALGSGVAYPWKLLADPANPGTLLAITGEGEQGGASLLYRLDAQTLAPIGTPLAVGSSASDIAWVGRTVAVAARSSAEVILVDVDSWRVLDDAAVFQDPIAVTAMGANRFAVASIRVKELQIFRTAGGVLTLERKIALPGIAYDVQYDAQYERLYVNQPALHAIIEIDAASGLVTRQHQVGGEPSYGGAIMGRYYVASDRDGYVHFIDRATGAAGRYDLHAPLGLDRATAALRGIDPTDVVVLDDRNLVVVNNRQDSLLLSFDAHAAFQAPTVRARFTGAAFGAGVAPVSGSAFGAGLGPAELLVTTPALHRIDRVRLVETNGQVTVSAQTYIVGVSPVAAVRLGTGPGATLAVLASNHTLRLVSEFDGTAKTFDTLAGHYVSARHPMAADREGRLWLICNGLTGRRLVAISAAGELLVDVPAPLSSPFSIAAATDTVVVIDRTHKQALEYDVPTGVGSLVTLSNDRPRHAEILARGEWIVIHDTNPDLGVTHSINGVRTFTPYIPGPAGRWLASSTLDAAGRPILLDFNGRILSYDVAQRKYQPLMTLSTEPAMVATFGYGRLWVVSPADSTVALIRPGAATPEAIWTDARAFDVIPAEGGAWLVTTAGLVWRKVANAAWWL